MELKEVVLNKIKGNTRSFRNENLYNAGIKWNANTIDDKNNKRIDTLPSGHHLYQTYNTHTGQHMFHAYDPEHQRSTISVQGRLKSGVLSHPYLTSHEKNTLPAHKFYAHLLNRGHLKAISTDSQSPGAQKVWSRLSKERGVGIHGWHKGKPVNVKYGEDETHDTPKGDPSVRDMRLIAHKKLKKEETTMKTYNQFINEARYAMRPPGGAYSKERQKEINYGVEPESPPKRKLIGIHYFKKAGIEHVGKHGIDKIGKDAYGIRDYGQSYIGMHVRNAEKELGEKSRRWEPKA